MQVNSRCRLFVMLLVFPFFIKVVMASPLYTTHSKARSESKFTSEVSNHIYISHRHRNLTAFTRTRSAKRLATVVQLKPWPIQMTSIAEIVTETIEKTTQPPPSLILSDSEPSQTHTLTLHSTHHFTVTSTTLKTSPTSSTEFYMIPPEPTPTLAVDTELRPSPTALPQITERKFFELPTATLVAVAIAGSVAVNLLIMILWIMLRQGCSHKTIGIAATEREFGPTDATEKEKADSPHDTIQMTRGVSPGLLGPRGTSPVELNIHPPPSTHQPLPMPLSSFWSAASSQWTIELARSHGDGERLDALEGPQHFVTFGLDTPVNPDLNSPTITDAPQAEHRMDGPGVDPSPEDERHTQTLPVPSAFRHSYAESSNDPRSPRRLSIPVFLENYPSPSASRYLPPQTQSTMNTSDRTYDLDVEDGLRDRESSQRVVEKEVDYGSVATSATSLASLPSVSSEAMTPRRHWTFVDIHGPSAYTASLQELDGILDHFSGPGSSRTLAGNREAPGALNSTGTQIFDRGSSSSESQFAAASSEPSRSHSFLYTDIGNSTGSSISHCRSTDAGCDTLHSFNYHGSIRTH